MKQEIRKATFEEYNDLNIKVEAIARKYHITRGEVARIAIEQGATPRKPSRFGMPIASHSTTAKGKEKAKRICPKCKKASENVAARFCWFCGSDVRSREHIAADGLKSLLPHLTLLPANERDTWQQALFTAIAALTK